MRQDLGQLRDKAIVLIDKYSKGGSHWAVRDKLWKLRNERLAHRQTEAAAVTGADATDGDIESFYQDNSKLIRLLLSLVAATYYDPEEAAQVYRHYATLFWAGVRGEQTEGHPNYRARPRG
jgi:AbiU2